MRWAQQENEEDRRIIGFKLEQQILSNVSHKEKIDIKKIERKFRSLWDFNKS